MSCREEVVLMSGPSRIVAGRKAILVKATLCAAALAVAGCASTRGGPIPYDEAGAFPQPDAPTAAMLESGYKIAPMDTLTVKVFKMEDLSGEYQVDLAGNISLPLIGEVTAANMTTAELDQTLTAKFGEKYLESPDVSVGIKESAGRIVTVDGAVKKAGAFTAIGPMTLMQAVALAGGVTEDANPRRVAIFRQIDGQRQAAAFDLVDIRRGQMQDPRVYPGDIIVIDGTTLSTIQKQLLGSLPVLSIFRPY
jgi:polysaccharide export outer membrane protein